MLRTVESFLLFSASYAAIIGFVVGGFYLI